MLGSEFLKRNNEQFKKIFRSFLTAVLVLSMTAIFAIEWITEYNHYIVLPFVQKGNILVFTIYAVLVLTFLKLYDGLRYGTYKKLNLIIAQLLAAVSAAFIVYLQIVLLSAGFVTVRPLVTALFGDAAVIVLINIIGEYLYKKIFPAKKTIVIYDNFSPEAFLSKISERKDKFNVTKIINVSEGLEVIEKLITESESVIIYDVHSEMRNKILKICFENEKRTYATTKVSDILIRGAECLHMFDTPLLLYRNIGLTVEQRFIKRSMDIIISLLMLIITSPLLLICALAIKIEDGGPVFFRQARETLGGKVFYIHKFRSMIVDAEKDGAPHPAEEADPRITPVGKILRATRLDELPQLIDILNGNMSLVGPRPERVEHIKQYTEKIPEFQYRLKVRGGLTGYAQLYGKYNTSPYDKLQLDLMYIENYSLLLDIRLLLMSVKIMFIKESTEGFSKEESKKITKKSKSEKK